MATCEKVGKRWRVREFSAGKLKTVANFKTKPEADALVRKLGVQKSARAVVRAAQIPMEEVIARWAVNRLAIGNDRESTAKSESRVTALCAARNWATTAGVTKAAVEKAIESGASPRGLAMLRAVLSWASSSLDQYVDSAALAALRPRRPARKAKAPLLSDKAVADLCTIAERMSPSAGGLVHCLSTYGWRPITAARLTVGDFDAESGTITTRVKGGDTVRHPLLEATVERLRLLTAGRPKSSPLFHNPQTGKKWPTYGARAIPQWARDHLKAASYDLKRYAISTMLGRGMAPQTVALFTGHRTISQVLAYARTNDELARAALAKIGGKILENGQDQTQQGQPGNGKKT